MFSDLARSHRLFEEYITYVLSYRFGQGIKGAFEICRIRLYVSSPTLGMILVIRIDAYLSSVPRIYHLRFLQARSFQSLTSCSEYSQMHPQSRTANRQVYRPSEIASQGLLFVILAPIHVRSPRDACAIEDVGWLDPFKLFLHALAVFHAYSRHMHFSSLITEQRFEMAGHPAAAAPDQEDVVLGCVRARHGCRCRAELSRIMFRPRVLDGDVHPQEFRKGVGARGRPHSIHASPLLPRE